MPRNDVTLEKTKATVDLDALVANYRRVVDELAGVQAAAVVKADGYGLGVGPVATALGAEGCRRFFVARPAEGVALRATLPEAEIWVLDGVMAGSTEDLLACRLIPVINSLDQLAAWRRTAAEADRALPAGLHVDTGMRRLGLPPDEFRTLVDRPDLLTGVDVRVVFSHLASADIDGHPQSAQQLAAFLAVRDRLPMGEASLANSAGIFLGSDYHFDLARPGICLYGGSPFPDSGRPNPMRQVVTIEAPIIQVRTAAAGDTVGYGATHRCAEGARVATIPVGYADGFLRSASNRGAAAIDGTPVPIIGRVSMDLITLDVSAVDERLIHPGTPVELLGDHCPVDDVATAAGSIPHELLTNLSRRFDFAYCGRPTER